MSKKCTPLWREAHFEVKMYKAPQLRGTFKSCDVEKVHAIVAQSTFRSQNVKKHQGFGPLLDVEMSLRVAGARDCAPCQKRWKREGFVSFSTTTTTTPHYTPIHYTTTNTLLQLQLQLQQQQYYFYTTLITLHSTTLHWMTLHYTYNYNGNCNCITLHYTTLMTLHYTTLHYTTLHYITLTTTLTTTTNT